MISSSSSLSSLEISEAVQPGWVLLSSAHNRDGRVFEVLRMTKLCQCLALFDFVLPLTWRGLAYRIYLMGAFIGSMCVGGCGGVAILMGSCRESVGQICLLSYIARAENGGEKRWMNGGSFLFC